MVYVSRALTHSVTDAPTGLFIAWGTLHHLHSVLACQSRKQQSNVLARWLRGYLRTQVERELQCFSEGVLFGSLLQDLVRWTVLHVDMSVLVTLFTPHQETLEEQEFAATIDSLPEATSVVWEAILTHPSDHARLRTWSSTWGGCERICQGARALAAFFLTYVQQVCSHLQTSFVITHCLLWSLDKIDWHLIAQQLLGMTREWCTCHAQPSERMISSALIRLFLEQAGTTLFHMSTRVEETVRTQALFLGDLCHKSSQQIAHSWLALPLADPVRDGSPAFCVHCGAFAESREDPWCSLCHAEQSGRTFYCATCGGSTCLRRSSAGTCEDCQWEIHRVTCCCGGVASVPVAERAQALRLLYDPQPSPHFTLLVPPASAEVRAYLTRLIPSHFGPDQIEVTMPATFHMAFSLDLLHQAFPELEVAPTARTVLADLCNFSGPWER